MGAVAAETVTRRAYVRPWLAGRGWPIYAFFGSLPVAWCLGLANLVLPVYGLLLLVVLLLRERVLMPPRFGMWLLFLTWVLLSALQLDSPDRAFAFGYRASLYLTATALFLYIFGASERALPTASVVKALTAYWALVVIGGLLGVAFPTVTWPSFAQEVIAPLLPGNVASVQFFQDITTPALADVQRILGFPVGRPKTFFAYTNEWGSTLVLLVPFVVIAMRMVGRAWRRVLGGLLVLMIIPLAFSLNRGAWLALLALLAYATFRFTAQGNVRALMRITVTVALVAAVIFATPLEGLIESRLSHGHSDAGREARNIAALELTANSPLVGYGAPQPAGEDSAAVGTHGQLFLLLVSHGVPALLFFVGWLGYTLARSASRGSFVQFWCHAVILVYLVQMPFYELTAFQLMVAAAAMGLAWREIIARRQSRPRSSGGPWLTIPTARDRVGFEVRTRPLLVARAAGLRETWRLRPREATAVRGRKGAVEAAPPDARAADVHRHDLSQVARGGALSLLGGAAFALLGFVLVLVVSHGLGAAGAGVFFEAVAIFMIVSRIAQIGADVGVLREMSRLVALGRAADIRQTLLIGLVPVAVVSTAIGGALYLFAPAISRLVVKGSSPELLVSYVRLWAPFLVLAALTAVMLAAARGLGSLVPFVSIENVGKPALQPLLALLLLGLGLGTTALALAWAVPIAIGFAITAWWVAALVARGAPAYGPLDLTRSLAERTRAFWAFASPRALAAVFQAMAAWVDVLLVGALASARAAGIYAAASRLALMGVLFLRALILVLGPQISGLLARDLRQRAQIVYQVSTWWLTLLSWPLYILLALFAPVAVGVFGEGFGAGDRVLAVLAIGMLISMACGPVSVVLLMAGKSSWNLFNTILAASLGIALNLVLIPRYGVLGAAIAAATTVAANNLIPLAQVWGFLRLHPLGRGFLIVAGSALFAYGVGGGLARMMLGATPLALALSGALGTLVYVVLLRRARETLRFNVIRDVLGSRGRRVAGGGAGVP